MTTRQIAEAAGVSVETVTRKIRELCPEEVKNGKPTNLPQPKALRVMSELRKTGFVAPIQNDEVPRQNGEVITRSDLAEFGRALVGEMMKQFLPLIQTRPALPDIVQDYFTIKGYANKVGVQVTYSEAITIGRAAVKLSRELGKEVRKADDERFGQVNSYHASVLKEVFQS